MPDDGVGVAIAESEHETQRIASNVQNTEGPKVTIIVGTPARCAAIAALVRSDNVVTGCCQCRHDLAPGIGSLRKSVPQQHERPVWVLKPSLHDMHPEAVDVVDVTRADA